MSERETVLVSEADGAKWWFDVADAERWPARSMLAGELFRVAGRWVRLSEWADLTREPARPIDDGAALDWLLSEGIAVPPELAALAEKRRRR